MEGDATMERSTSKFLVETVRRMAEFNNALTQQYNNNNGDGDRTDVFYHFLAALAQALDLDPYICRTGGQYGQSAESQPRPT